MRLETPRLRLRPFAPSDEEALYALFRDDHVRRYLLDGALVERAWVHNEIAESARRFAAGGLGLFAIELVETGRTGIIGVTGFRPDHEPPVLELIYAFLPAFNGRGLALEAARAAVNWAFSAHGLDVLHAAVDVPNEASLRLLHKLGFLETRRSPGAFGDMLHLELRRPG